MKKEIMWVVVLLPNPHMGDPSNHCLRVYVLDSITKGVSNSKKSFLLFYFVNEIGKKKIRVCFVNEIGLKRIRVCL